MRKNINDLNSGEREAFKIFLSIHKANDDYREKRGNLSNRRENEELAAFNSCVSSGMTPDEINYLLSIIENNEPDD